MYLNNVDPLVRAAKRRYKLEKRKRRLNQSSDELKREREEHRQLRKRVSRFFDAAAVEAPSDDESEVESEVPCLLEAFDHLLPRDSRGKPYLTYRFPTCRLGNIRTDEWYDLSFDEQARVRRLAVKYHRIKFMIEAGRRRRRR